MTARDLAPADPSASWLAVLNGRRIPYSDAAIPIWDYGFTMGVTLTERLRTFGGELPLLDRHLNRLFASVKTLQLDIDRREVEAAIRQVAVGNRGCVAADSDLAIGVCLTPGGMTSALPAGISASDAAIPVSGPGCPTRLIFAGELDFAALDLGYRQGTALTLVEIREVPGASIPKHVKHRNRLHYYLAELQARAKFPGTRALLLDHEGMVAEATTGSVVIIKGNQIIAPPPEKVLPSISFEFAQDLFDEIGLVLQRRDVTPQELFEADEVVWFSSSTLIQPITRIDGRPIGDGQPGAVFAKLLRRCNQRLGLDLAGQAAAMAKTPAG